MASQALVSSSLASSVEAARQLFGGGKAVIVSRKSSSLVVRAASTPPVKQGAARPLWFASKQSLTYLDGSFNSVMSENGSAHHIEADESEPQPQGQKKPIHFDEEGQPIGYSSIQYVTFIGKMARMHCPPTYIDWPTVPETNKKHVWDAVLESYDIQFTCKVSVLRKANIAWKSRKYTLRKIYDEYPTNAERRLNIPKGIRPEDWENFIEFCSADDDRIRRARGKASRAHMKLPHTIGRWGSARTKEELKKQSSNGKVMRTQLFVVTHTRTDGTTFSETRPTLDEIKRLVTLDPNLGEYDLDNDVVAMACGPDGKGRV